MLSDAQIDELAREHRVWVRKGEQTIFHSLLTLEKVRKFARALLAAQPVETAQESSDPMLKAIMERDAWRNAMVGLCQGSKWPTTPDEAADHLRARLHPAQLSPAPREGDERAAFERVMGDEPFNWYRNLFRDANGEYATLTARTAWEAWQARAALAQKASPIAVATQDALRAVHSLLHTQDNRITAAPMFAVQQKKRVYGLDSEYSSAVGWFGDEGHQADGEQAVELEALHDADGTTEKDGYHRVGYSEYWEFVTACFTEQGCKDYLARNGHNLGETRIYAYGTYRNNEWSLVRDFLMSDSFAAPKPAHPLNPSAQPVGGKS